MIRVPVCARVSRVCPGSPRCLFTGTLSSPRCLFYRNFMKRFTRLDIGVRLARWVARSMKTAAPDVIYSLPPVDTVKPRTTYPISETRPERMASSSADASKRPVKPRPARSMSSSTSMYREHSSGCCSVRINSNQPSFSTVTTLIHRRCLRRRRSHRRRRRRRLATSLH